MKKYNKELLNLLSLAIEAYPTLRFNQILQSLDFVITESDSDGTLKIKDEYYLQPKKQLERVKKAFEKLTS